MNAEFRYSSFVCFRLAFAATALVTCSPISRASPIELTAHRGGYLHAPENTCASFRSCSGLVDRIEFDVRVTADGEWVLMHDDTVNRTTTGYGTVTNVASLTLAQLKTLDVGAKFSPTFAGERIPTFAEALRSLPPGISPMVHRKTGTASNMVSFLRRENALSNTIIACEDYGFLLSVRQLEPSLQLCYIGSGTIENNNLSQLLAHGISVVSWDKTTTTTGLVNQVHYFGMRIHVWSINTPEIETYLDMGVDGLIVDDPAQAKKWQPSPPSSNAQLAQDLVAYWKFDDGLLDATTTTAADVEADSLGNLFGFSSSPSWLAGDEARVNGALRLDGINDYVRIPANEPLNIGTNAVTISLWVKLSVLPSALSNAYSGIYDSTIDAYSIYLDRTSRELRFKITDSTNQAARPGIPEAKLKTGVWHHVVGVYAGSVGPFSNAVGQAMIFLDGHIVDIHNGDDASGFGLTGTVRSGQAAAIGRNGTENSSYFAGAIDDVAIWRRYLSPGEIRQIYIAGTNGIPLERNVMTIWITNIYPMQGTTNMQFDVRVDHGSLTNQPLRLRGANRPTDSYSDQTVLEGGHGHHASFFVPSPDGHHNNPPPTQRDEGSATFFQISYP